MQCRAGVNVPLIWPQSDHPLCQLFRQLDILYGWEHMVAQNVQIISIHIQKAQLNPGAIWLKLRIKLPNLNWSGGNSELKWWQHFQHKIDRCLSSKGVAESA